MQDVLCVEYDNSAVKGNFFILDSWNQSELESTFLHDSSSSTPSERNDRIYALNGSYTFGERLVSFYVNETNMEEIFYPGLLHIFSPSDAGYCNEISYAEFGRNVDYSCTTLIDAANVQDLCSDVLSIDRAVHEIRSKNSIFHFACFYQINF